MSKIELEKKIQQRKMPGLCIQIVLCEFDTCLAQYVRTYRLKSFIQSMEFSLHYESSKC